MICSYLMSMNRLGRTNSIAPPYRSRLAKGSLCGSTCIFSCVLYESGDLGAMILLVLRCRWPAQLRFDTGLGRVAIEIRGSPFSRYM